MQLPALATHLWEYLGILNDLLGPLNKLIEVDQQYISIGDVVILLKEPQALPELGNLLLMAEQSLEFLPILLGLVNKFVENNFTFLLFCID